MELYQLRTFAAVAELGSLTQAAERLHLSQPAASAQIKLLEEEFGIALFERKPSGLALSRAGAALLPGIQALLASAEQVVSNAKSLSGRVTGPIRFATVATVSDKSLLRLGAMMNLIVTRHPRLDIEVQHRNSRSIELGVVSGELDAGMSLGCKDIPKVRRILLKELPYRIVAPLSWGERMRKASWKELAAAPWISAPKGGSHHQMAMQLFKKLRRQPPAVIEADSEPLITSLVRAGVGLSLMREDLALHADSVGALIVIDKGRPSTFLQVLYRAARENDPSIQAFLGVLRELWPEQDRPDSDRSKPVSTLQSREPAALTAPTAQYSELSPFKDQLPTI